MIVQSLPFAAAVCVSMVNALEQMRHARTVFEAAPAARDDRARDAARAVETRRFSLSTRSHRLLASAHALG